MNADEEMDLLEEEFQHLNELDDHLKFYHANVSSHVAEMLIQQFKQNNQNIKSGIFLLRDDPYKENNFILSVHHLSVTLHVKLEQIDEAFFRIGGCSLFHGLDTFVERAGLSEHASLPCRLQHFVRGEFIPSWTRRLGRTLALHELIGRAYQMEQLFNSLFYFGIDSKDSDGNSALVLACIEGNSMLVEALLASGASVRIRDKDGYSPLHICCKYNHFHLLEALISGYKAAVNDKNPSNYWTPLHVAAFNNAAATVSDLVTKFGALLMVRTKGTSTTPLDLACLNDATASREILDSLIKESRSESSYEDWLHCKLEYEEAAALLESVGKPDELFLVTENKIEPNNYNLIFCHENNINNFEISLTSNGKFQIGCGSMHKTLESLIDFHRTDQEVLPCLLSKCLNKHGEIVRDLSASKRKAAVVVKLDANKAVLLDDNNRRIESVNQECLRSFKGRASALQWIPADNIEIGQKIGEGEFGFVYAGRYTDKTSNQIIPIAIKHLKLKERLNDFFREAKVITLLKHSCILQIYGVCFVEKMIILELAQYGSMQTFPKEHTSLLNVSVMKLWTMQIAKGMMYLESKNLVHRDLASRNILVSSLNQVKIADFGMTRKLLPGEVFVQAPEEKIPFRWYPLEALEHNEYGRKVDIWAYGVTIWELFSLGSQPYAGFGYQQVFEFLQSGLRLSMPINCPSMLYDLMLRCWSPHQRMRPSFVQINEFFTWCPDFYSLSCNQSLAGYASIGCLI